MSSYTRADLLVEIDRLGPWYHKIDLGAGVVTPGYDYDTIWDQIRQTRACLDYTNKTVLDIASYDGLWAFEAERLGALLVVATDCNYRAVANFLFCRAVLKSAVIPYFNVSPYNLVDRLDVHLQEVPTALPQAHHLFDIAQHLGLLYHLRDPMLSLLQTRSLLRTGGHLLLDTAALPDETGSYLIFNGIPPDPGRVYDDLTTWWAPSLLCLKEMLRASLFREIPSSIKMFPQTTHISRVSLVAVAVGPESIPEAYFRELSKGYRNPGLAVANIAQPASRSSP